MLHPRKDHQGKPVVLTSPSQPSSLDAWWDNRITACVVPDGDIPEELCRIRFDSVRDLPLDAASWEQRAASMVFDEPAFPNGNGLRATHAIVNRDPEQYPCTDDREDIGRIESLVKGLAQRNLSRLREVQAS